MPKRPKSRGKGGRPRTQRSGQERIFEARLYPTAKQAARFNDILWLCRNVWNAALAEYRSEYARYKRFGLRADYESNWPTYQSQYDQLIESRDEFDWIDKTIYAETLTEVLKRLANSMKRFMKREGGFPRFKSLHDFRTFTVFHADRCLDYKPDAKRFCLKAMRGLGLVKWRAGKRKPPAAVANLKVSCKRGKWYAYFQHDVDADARAIELQERNAQKRNNRLKSENRLGLDFGVVHAVATSDGKLIANPRFQRKYADKVADLQREMSRLRPKPGQRSSPAYKLVCASFGRLMSKVASCRRDWQHKITRSLVDTHRFFAAEDLELRNMTASAAGTVAEPGKNVSAKAGLNRSLLDVGIGATISLLSYKASEAGGDVAKRNPRRTSQTCSRCGQYDPNSRIERGRFVCTRCGLAIHADINAARNIRKLGLLPASASLAALRPSSREGPGESIAPAA